MNYIHENNLLSVSSQTVAIGQSAPKSIGQFWSQYQIADFVEAANAIITVETALVAEGLSTSSNEFTQQLLAQEDLQATSRMRRAFIEEYSKNIHPLFSRKGELETLQVLANELLAYEELSSGNNQAIQEGIREAVRFNLHVLLYVVRLAMTNCPPSRLDAERLVVMRESLFRMRGAKASVRWALPFILVSRMYSPQLRAAVNDQASSPSRLRDVLGVKADYCDRFTELTLAFLRAKPHAPIEEAQNAFHAIVPKADRIVLTTLGDLLAAFHQLPADRVARERENDTIGRLLAMKTSTPASVPNGRDKGKSVSPTPSMFPTVAIQPTVGLPYMNQQQLVVGVAAHKAAGLSVTMGDGLNHTSPLSGLGTSVPSVRVGNGNGSRSPHNSTTTSSGGERTPTSGNRKTPVTPPVASLKSEDEPAMALPPPSNRKLRPPVNSTVAAEFEATMNWCDPTAMLFFVVTAMSETDTVSLSTLNRTFAALEACCDNDRKLCEEIMDLPPPTVFLELLDLAYRIINPNDPSHRRIVRKGKDAVLEREAKKEKERSTIVPAQSTGPSISLISGTDDPSDNIWGMNTFANAWS